MQIPTKKVNQPNKAINQKPSKLEKQGWNKNCEFPSSLQIPLIQN